MKFYLTIFFILSTIFSSCISRQSLEEKADADARNFNRRYCPTPVINHIRTDSISFNPDTHVFTYSYTFCEILDDINIVELNKEKIANALHSNIKNSTSMKTYIESGYRFHIVCHSEKSPNTILFQLDVQ